MLEFRALYVLSGGGNELLFSKHFPYVEMRVKVDEAISHEKLDLLNGRIEDARLIEEFLIKKNSDPNTWTSPVMSLCNDDIWPVVFVQEQGFYFLAVPLLEKSGEKLGEKEDRSVHKFLEITQTLVFLEEFARLVVRVLLSEGSGAKGLRDVGPRESAIIRYLVTTFLPLGSPLVSKEQAMFRLLHSLPKATPQNIKVPGWNIFYEPQYGSGGRKQRIEFIIRDTVSVHIFSKKEIRDTWNVQCSILANSQVEGSPEVSFFLPHTCMKSLEFTIANPAASSSNMIVSNQFTFNPGSHTQEICRCMVKKDAIKQLPFNGVYTLEEMSGTSADFRSVHITLKIRLNYNMKNAFDYLDVVIPYSGYGKTMRRELTATPGSIIDDVDKKCLYWKLGRKIQTKSWEATLNGVLTFATGEQSSMAEEEKESTETVGESDAFSPSLEYDSHTGLNSFVEVRFKLLGASVSNVSIDPKKVLMFPTSKANISVRKEILSKRYLVWNRNSSEIPKYLTTE